MFAMDSGPTLALPEAPLRVEHEFWVLLPQPFSVKVVISGLLVDSAVAFYRVGQRMDSGYFMLEEAKDLLTVSVLTKCVVQSSVMDCLNGLLASLLIMESPVDINDLLLL